MKRLLTLMILITATVQVFSSEDIKGAWVASVFNINFPSKPGLTASEQQKEIRDLLDAAVAAGLNSLFVQVRPESDALYSSSYEPWSIYLTGTQGEDPGYDPLGLFVSEAKLRGLKIHAWINPYRASADAKIKSSSVHISHRLSQYARKVDNVIMMDPGSKEVQEHIVKVVKEIVTKYDVAGIHFDDYFYPYPKHGISTPFPDDDVYTAYRNSGGRLRKDDWRRENVNILIKAVSEAVHEVRPDALFGVSPFGIFAQGRPLGIKTGVDQFGQLYCEPLRWMREGWVDYIAPQLYWTAEGPQSFRKLLKWWRSSTNNPRGVTVCPGIAAYRMISHGWSADEIENQLKLERSIEPNKSGGFIIWNIEPVANDVNGIRSVIKKY